MDEMSCRMVFGGIAAVMHSGAKVKAIRRLAEPAPFIRTGY